jgi:hypothetical protein
MSDLEDIPVDPDEATDLKLHVKNCMKRHTALVKLISREKIFTWIYRALVLPGLGYVVFKLATIQPDVLALIAD